MIYDEIYKGELLKEKQTYKTFFKCFIFNRFYKNNNSRYFVFPPTYRNEDPKTLIQQ